MSLESLARLMRERMKDESLSQRSAAADIGISKNTLNLLLQAKSTPTSHTRCLLALWLKMPPTDLRAIVTGRDQGPTTDAALRQDPVALLIHDAGPIARAIACAAVDAERKYHT
jgi:transcriptional regulator with XRE-family HTH domain